MVDTDEKVGNDVYRGFVRRILRAYGRRIGTGDIAALPELVALRDELDAVIADAVTQLRAEPFAYSWTQIGRALGISRQAVEQRYGGIPGARKDCGRTIRRRPKC